MPHTALWACGTSPVRVQATEWFRRMARQQMTRVRASVPARHRYTTTTATPDAFEFDDASGGVSFELEAALSEMGESLSTNTNKPGAQSMMAAEDFFTSAKSTQHGVSTFTDQDALPSSSSSSHAGDTSYKPSVAEVAESKPTRRLAFDMEKATLLSQTLARSRASCLSTRESQTYTQVATQLLAVLLVPSERTVAQLDAVCHTLHSDAIATMLELYGSDPSLSQKDPSGFLATRLLECLAVRSVECAPSDVPYYGRLALTLTASALSRQSSASSGPSREVIGPSLAFYVACYVHRRVIRRGRAVQCLDIALKLPLCCALDVPEEEKAALPRASRASYLNSSAACDLRTSVLNFMLSRVLEMTDADLSGLWQPRTSVIDLVQRTVLFAEPYLLPSVLRLAEEWLRAKGVRPSTQTHRDGKAQHVYGAPPLQQVLSQTNQIAVGALDRWLLSYLQGMRTAAPLETPSHNNTAEESRKQVATSSSPPAENSSGDSVLSSASSISTNCQLECAAHGPPLPQRYIGEISAIIGALCALPSDPNPRETTTSLRRQLLSSVHSCDAAIALAPHVVFYAPELAEVLLYRYLALATQQLGVVGDAQQEEAQKSVELLPHLAAVQKMVPHVDLVNLLVFVATDVLPALSSPSLSPGGSSSNEAQSTRERFARSLAACVALHAPPDPALAVTVLRGVAEVTQRRAFALPPQSLHLLVTLLNNTRSTQQATDGSELIRLVDDWLLGSESSKQLGAPNGREGDEEATHALWAELRASCQRKRLHATQRVVLDYNTDAVLHLLFGKLATRAVRPGSTLLYQPVLQWLYQMHALMASVPTELQVLQRFSPSRSRALRISPERRLLVELSERHDGESYYSGAGSEEVRRALAQVAAARHSSYNAGVTVSVPDGALPPCVPGTPISADVTPGSPSPSYVHLLTQEASFLALCRRLASLRAVVRTRRSLAAPDVVAAYLHLRQVATLGAATEDVLHYVVRPTGFYVMEKGGGGDGGGSTRVVALREAGPHEAGGSAEGESANVAPDRAAKEESLRRALSARSTLESLLHYCMERAAAALESDEAQDSDTTDGTVSSPSLSPERVDVVWAQEALHFCLLDVLRYSAVTAATRPDLIRLCYRVLCWRRDRRALSDKLEVDRPAKGKEARPSTVCLSSDDEAFYSFWLSTTCEDPELWRLGATMLTAMEDICGGPLPRELYITVMRCFVMHGAAVPPLVKERLHIPSL